MNYIRVTTICIHPDHYPKFFLFGTTFVHVCPGCREQMRFTIEKLEKSR